MRSDQADQFIAKISNRKTPYFKTLNKIKLKISKGVYPTGKIGKLFAKAFLLPQIAINTEKRVLDYGTGTGFLAILAAKSGAQVVAIDKSPIAIDCAMYNAKKNHVQDNIEFRISNNLSAILENEKFDIILAGLPWENAIPNTPLEMAFYDKNFSMRRDLVERSAKILTNQTGIILLSYSKRVQEINPIEKFFVNFNSKILIEKNINGEPHYIYLLNCNI